MKEESSDSNATNKESIFVGKRSSRKIRAFTAPTFGQSSSNNNFSKCEFRSGSSRRATRGSVVSSYIKQVATIAPVNQAGGVQKLTPARYFGSRRPWKARVDSPAREPIASSDELPLCGTGDSA
jgi:hypothetical protein